MKKFFFYVLMLLPLLVIVATPLYFIFFTNVPQLLYARANRNIYFDCMVFVSDDYVYKLKPGPCTLNNIEYKTIVTSDADGFRNAHRKSKNYDVAVLGDSHAHGFGVQDDQTFSDLLESKFHFPTLNLAIGSYATMRELEALAKYGAEAKYVVIQYCDNDAPENEASLRFSKAEFKFQVETRWKATIAKYAQGKALGLLKPMYDLADIIKTGSFVSKSAWQHMGEARNIQSEASLFAQVVARYRPLLEGKRLIVLEAAGWGANSPNFKTAFAAELKKIDWLRFRVINTASILDFRDYFFVDEHIAASGHRKLADAIANEIASWEKADQIIAR